MHKEHFDNLISLTVAMLVAVVALPFTSQAMFRSVDQDGNHMFEQQVPDLIKIAKADRSVQSERRHNFYRAMELYRDRTKNGEENLLVPDINNASSVQFYLDAAAKTEEASSGHAAAEDPKVALKDISSTDRTLLRQFEHTGNCPTSLKSYIPGFYELCLSLIVGKPKARVGGFLNDLANIQRMSGALPNTLANRLKMVRQAREGTKAPSVEPSRMRTAAPTR